MSTNKVINIDGKMFRRPEAWFGLFQRSASFDGSPVTAPLYLGTCRGAATIAPERNKLADVFPTYNGEKIPFVVEARPAELTLVTECGNIRFTFASKSYLYAEGDPGMGLFFEKSMGQHESVHKRWNKAKEEAWEVFFRVTCTIIFKGLNGSGFEFINPDTGEYPWNWAGLSSGKILGRTTPAPDGTFTLVLDESVFNGFVRDEYPTYAEAKASMQSAWEGFISKIKPLAEPYEDLRFTAAHTIWSYLLAPQHRHIPSTQIQFFAGVIASQWQMCQNAVALQDIPELSVSLLQGPIDQMGPDGQLPDMYDEVTFETQCTKPPMHGWALKQIMARHDLVAEVGSEKIETLYAGLRRWANWWQTIRDDDGDGLPVVYHPDETGIDDCSLFFNHNQLVTPDVCAYLVLLLEANGDLAKALGKPESESAEWYKKSADLLKLFVDTLWDGEHFLGLVPETGERIICKSLIHYMPGVLGDRLPKEIVDKLVDDLSDPALFNTPYGIASEHLDSEFWNPPKWGLGSVTAPLMLFLCTGLWQTHRRDDVRKFVSNYCSTAAKTNLPLFIDAKTGEGLFPGSSWACCVYLTLARLLSE